jgi:hypothetical protein
MPNLKRLKINRIFSQKSLLVFLIAMPIFSQNVRAETETSAMYAAAADTVSTAASLSRGLVELNPLGLAGTVVVKVAAITYIHKLPEEDRAEPYSVVYSFWGGAAANNLCWLTGAGPLCFVLGIATGIYLWSNGEDERTYWASCKSNRLVHPEAPCSRSDQKINRDQGRALALAL